jgi:4-hydroxy-L-threonine phosphate dehydrogenase PdxA
MKIKPILIVAGGPKSIFFEIFFKTLKRVKYKSPIILICSKNLFIKQMKLFNFNKKFELLKISKINSVNIMNKSLYIIDVKLNSISLKNFSKKSEEEYLKKSFNLAFKILSLGLSYKLINGPINKKFLNKNFLGITEYISNHFKIKNTGMLIHNKSLSVCPLTTHLPIKMVAKNITKKLIYEKIDLINYFFKNFFKIKPKIAIVGLNPHCESILKFNEDEKILKPVIKNIKKKKIDISGPFSADTIFIKQNRERFNVIIGMYHDQVISPFKTLYEYDAINVTMGLPFLRVSPDHGPNEKMVNKNLSNPISLIRALEFLDKN